VNIHWIYRTENIFTVQDFWTTCACLEKQSFSAKFSLYSIYFLPFKIFEQLCAYPEKQSLPWNFSLYSIYFLHSGFLSNLRLPWIRCIEYIFFTVTCGEVRDWGGAVSFKAKFASVWIEWSSIKLFTVFKNCLTTLLKRWNSLTTYAYVQNACSDPIENADHQYDRQLQRTSMKYAK